MWCSVKLITQNPEHEVCCIFNSCARKHQHIYIFLSCNNRWNNKRHKIKPPQTTRNQFCQSSQKDCLEYLQN